MVSVVLSASLEGNKVWPLRKRQFSDLLHRLCIRAKGSMMSFHDVRRMQFRNNCMSRVGNYMSIVSAIWPVCECNFSGIAY